MNFQVVKLFILILLSFVLSCDGQSKSSNTAENSTEVGGYEELNTPTAGNVEGDSELTGTDMGMDNQPSNRNYVPDSEINTADDLIRTITLIENVINHAVRQFCDRCPSLVNICDQGGQYTQYNMDERVANCLFSDAESSGFNELQVNIQCEVMMANQVVDCLAMQTSCNRTEFLGCVQHINFQSCIESSELSRLENQCFGDSLTFTCEDGEDISRALVCDGNLDCFNGEDERADCPPPFECEDGSSIPRTWVCDGTADCAGGADESREMCP